jgi:molybdopterin/thiamine biosynthesis adenylyltransferase
MTHSRSSVPGRYVRQTAFAEWGPQAQGAFERSRALVVGVGGLGSWVSELLVRAGVGFLRLIDDDLVDLTNIHRQALYGPTDAAMRRPKVSAASDRLKGLNDACEIDVMHDRLDRFNINRLAGDVDVVVDGTDNCVKTRRPWVFAGVVRAEAQVMTIIPGQTACLRCVMESPPPACTDPSCREAGVLGPAVSAIASIEGLEAMKILGGRLETISPYLLRFDLWSNTMQRIRLDGPQDDPPCPCCGLGEFEYLEP